jgi:BlaI family transcriptional regulator, penicillinase repressor
MEELTKTEEKIMQILWKIKKGMVKDVIEQLPKPHPPYNTISSVVRILEKKGFVKHKAYGKTYEYSPRISKSAYKKHTFKTMVNNYFDNSYKDLVSFLVDDTNISDKELAEIKNLIAKKEDEQQNR